MSQILVNWNLPPVRDSKGIIVGCTKNQEWLLPWWWMNFRLHNNYPVTFIDFGDMSPQALEWCEKRGTLLSLTISDEFIKKKEEIDPKIANKWDLDGQSANPWIARSAWFKKPFALLLSPFEKTVWMDLDCQCNGSIHPLFDDYLQKGDVILAPESEIDQRLNLENGSLEPGRIMYNTGILGYRHGAELIEEWARKALELNHLFYGDQQLLVSLIRPEHSLVPLPLSYNWPIARHGINPQAIILHWWGEIYKVHIFRQINALKNNFFINLYL